MARTFCIKTFKNSFDFIFPEQELSILRNTFFVRKESDWQYQGIESLKQIQLAAISGYDYGDELRAYIQESGSSHVSLLNSQGHPLAKGIELLHRHRVDAIVEADPVFWYTAQTLGLQENFKTAGHSDEPQHSYITFSPTLPTSEKYAVILSDGIQKLRESGELEQILNRYGLTDWRWSR